MDLCTCVYEHTQTLTQKRTHTYTKTYTHLHKDPDSGEKRCPGNQRFSPSDASKRVYSVRVCVYSVCVCVCTCVHKSSRLTNKPCTFASKLLFTHVNGTPIKDIRRRRARVTLVTVCVRVCVRYLLSIIAYKSSRFPHK